MVISLGSATWIAGPQLAEETNLPGHTTYRVVQLTQASSPLKLHLGLEEYSGERSSINPRRRVPIPFH